MGRISAVGGKVGTSIGSHPEPAGQTPMPSRWTLRPSIRGRLKQK